MRITTVEHLNTAVSMLKEVSERYAPNVEMPADQWRKVLDEVYELRDAWLMDLGKPEPFKDAAKECADVIIAAVRLGTMLSDDFAKVILDKCKELNEREPLK